MHGARATLVLALLLVSLPHVPAQALDEVQQAILDRHNYWRANVNPPAGTRA